MEVSLHDTRFIIHYKTYCNDKRGSRLIRSNGTNNFKKEKDGLIECVYKDNWKQFGSKIFYLEDIERLKKKMRLKALARKK